MRHLISGRIAAMGVAGWLAALSAHGEITGLVKSERVNLRAAPSVLSEIICQLHEGETVVILESIKPDRPRPGEQAEWLKIRLPSNTPVWLSAAHIDDTSSAVTASRLNVRAGPGENFSIVGSLARGAVVREIRVVDNWMEIESPPDCYGFVAAPYIHRPEGTPPPALASATPSPSPTTTQAPPVPAAPENPPPPSVGPPTATGQAPPQTPTPAPAPAGPTPGAPMPTTPVPATTAVPVVQPAPVPAASEPAETGGPSPRRIVRREGIVAETMSIQAPTTFHLKSADTGRSLNFLLPGDSSMRLARFRGQRVVVSGEEQLDPRWPQHPMIEVQSIQLAP